MRKGLVALLLVLLVAPPVAGRADPSTLAGCSNFARATSLTWDDLGEECSDFFILEGPATVIVRLDGAKLVGTLGAALVEGERAVATFKRTFAGGTSIDGPVEMTVSLPAGNWRLRTFAGVSPQQPCGPAVPFVWSCSLVPGAAVGEYAASVRLA